MLDTDPEYAEARHRLGLVVYRRGKLDEEIRHLEQSVRLAADSAGYHNDLAIVLGKMGRIQDAMTGFENALVLVSICMKPAAISIIC